MKRILSMRRQYKAFGRGDMQFLNVENPKILAFTRTYENETLLVVANLSKYAQAVELDLSLYKTYVPVELFSKNRFPAVRESSPYFLTLSPYAFYWFALEEQQAQTKESSHLPRLNLTDWNAVTDRDTLSILEENVLLPYLTKATWFAGNAEDIHHLSVTNYATIPLEEDSAVVLLAEVNYNSGLPETYQLVIAFAKDEMAGKLNTYCPESLIARIKVDGQEGFLCDAFYIESFQQQLIKHLAAGSVLEVAAGTLRFYANNSLQQFVTAQPGIKPRIHPTEIINTAITYNNCFFLKMYRKVDKGENPDVELTRYLTEEAKFLYVPAFVGAIEWQLGKDTMTLGKMQAMVENHGDYHNFMLQRIDNFIERILARDREKLLQYPTLGSLTNPVSFDELPADLQEFLSPTAAEQIRLLGVRTGQMHLALAADQTSKAFQPEEFSLHYQRSLFSSMQALVREATGNLNKYMNKLPEEVQQDAKTIVARRQDILDRFKKIYEKKLNVQKIRIHGNYHTQQVLITGKDVAIKDFSGNPSRSYSEKRLKHSPLRDVATMIHSLYDVAYEGFLINKQVHPEEMESLKPFILLWIHYMTSFFMKAYLDTVAGSALIPREKADIVLMIHTYLLEEAVADVNREVVKRPDWARIPLRVIKAILK